MEQSDTDAFAAMFGTRRATPEENLCLAILIRAFLDLTDPEHRDNALKYLTYKYPFSTPRTQGCAYVFSIVSICETLRLERDTIKKMIALVQEMEESPGGAIRKKTLW